VFGWLLPQFIDYDEVSDALTELSLGEFAVLLTLCLARVPTEALMYRAFLPGLSWVRGSEAYLSSNFASQLLPPPTASIVQFGYFRAEGYPADAAGLAAAGSFVFPTIGRFLLPVVALVVLLVTDEVSGSLVVAAVVSLVITAVAGLGAFLLMRSERSARWVGRKAERPLSWILVRTKREPPENGADQAVALRRRSLLILAEGWRLGSIGVALNLLLTYLILLAALRFVGVPAAELSAAGAFAAFAIAFWAGAALPITGSGLGVVDVVLVAMLVEQSVASDDALLAASLLWRVFYSVIPLPLGAITLSRFRRDTPPPQVTRPLW
jgi:uncharacterized membrane protein YbhN (UPF0104 family)